MKFEKVSFERFYTDWKEIFHLEESDELALKVREIYDGIKLPKRATKGSAGYDFFAPVDLELKTGETLMIPTGIRAKMEMNYVLMLFPRSGLGFKYRMQLDNTVGVIDADYYGAGNEGHIQIKFTNDSKSDTVMKVEAGKGFAQGVFIQYGLTEDDQAFAKRKSGLGSTDEDVL